jgi:hypothetical protein
VYRCVCICSLTKGASPVGILRLHTLVFQVRGASYRSGNNTFGCFSQYTFSWDFTLSINSNNYMVVEWAGQQTEFDPADGFGRLSSNGEVGWNKLSVCGFIPTRFLCVVHAVRFLNLGTTGMETVASSIFFQTEMVNTSNSLSPGTP